MGATIWWGLVLVLAVIAAVVYFIVVRNRLLRLGHGIDKAWANIDVLLKQRHDELPKLIGTCRAYMPDEQSSLQLIAEARTAFLKAVSVSQKAQADDRLSRALKTLFAVAGKYPELKTNSSFLQLRRHLAELEEKAASQCRSYNDSVNSFNRRIGQLPDVLVAGLMSLKRKERFQGAEADRRDVEVKLT